jgi:type IV secretory pathway VirB2 component (pilin)
MDAPVVSLFDPPASSVLLAAATWMEGTMLGTLATVIAIMAIAAIGVAMFEGRIELRRGMTVVAGCFVLFGARAIATGLLSLADLEPAAEVFAPEPPMPLVVGPSILPQAPANPAFDPYAGAAAPR